MRGKGKEGEKDRNLFSLMAPLLQGSHCVICISSSGWRRCDQKLAAYYLSKRNVTKCKWKWTDCKLALWSLALAKETFCTKVLSNFLQKKWSIHFLWQYCCFMQAAACWPDAKCSLINSYLGMTVGKHDWYLNLTFQDTCVGQVS